MTLSISAQTVIDFWGAMTEHFRTRVVDKHDAPEMRAVAWFLEQAGILDSQAFMTRFSTTIGETIYVPFEIGEGSDLARWAQMSTCVHEHVHVEQYRCGGALKFFSRYLLDRTERAKIEAEAMRANLEMDWWRLRKLRDIPTQAEKLRSYDLHDEHIAFVATYLELSAPSIRKGAVSSEPSRIARQWLDTNAKLTSSGTSP